MGMYINPPDCSKEKWLNDNAKWATDNVISFDEHHYPECAVVCLVDNGPFTAAAICFNKQEHSDFSQKDGRAKLWLLVEKVKLQTLFTPEEWNRYFNEAA